MVEESIDMGCVVCGSVEKKCLRFLCSRVWWWIFLLNFVSLEVDGSLLQMSSQVILRQLVELVSCLIGQFWQCRMFLLLLMNVILDLVEVVFMKLQLRLVYLVCCVSVEKLMLLWFVVLCRIGNLVFVLLIVSFVVWFVVVFMWIFFWCLFCLLWCFG